MITSGFGRFKEVLQTLEQQYGGFQLIEFDVMLLWCECTSWSIKYNYFTPAPL